MNKVIIGPGRVALLAFLNYLSEFFLKWTLISFLYLELDVVIYFDWLIIFLLN